MVLSTDPLISLLPKHSLIRRPLRLQLAHELGLTVGEGFSHWPIGMSTANPSCKTLIEE